MRERNTDEATSEVLALCPLPDYRQSRAHIFRSEQSLQWFIRQRRQQLVEAGALRMIAGRWHVMPARFDSIVLEAGHIAARQEAAT